jgi:hypothetical protein
MDRRQNARLQGGCIMKKLVIISALVMAGTLSAHAQRQFDPNDPNAAARTSTRPQKPATGTPTTPPAKTPPPAAKPVAPPPAPVVVRPAPPPVIAPKVFIPVAPPERRGWTRNEHPYQARHHRECQEKSHRLHSYERHAADDGYISPRERRIIRELQRDLDQTCGGFRWRR